MSQYSLWITLFGLGFVGMIVFSFVLFYGAPFLPTRRGRAADALDLLDLKPGQMLLELGSGDGRILREAASRGIRCIGYELNPVLVAWSVLRTWKYRHLITVHCRNYWSQPLPDTDGIYVFLLQPYMAKLDTKIRKDIRRPVKLVSFAFHIPAKQTFKEKDGLLLYRYVPSKLA